MFSPTGAKKPRAVAAHDAEHHLAPHGHEVLPREDGAHRGVRSVVPVPAGVRAVLPRSQGQGHQARPRWTLR